jgi:hypothetical protein
VAHTQALKPGFDASAALPLFRFAAANDHLFASNQIKQWASEVEAFCQAQTPSASGPVRRRKKLSSHSLFCLSFSSLCPFLSFALSLPPFLRFSLSFFLSLSLFLFLFLFLFRSLLIVSLLLGTVTSPPSTTSTPSAAAAAWNTSTPSPV